MYYGLFGRCSFPRFGTYNRTSRPSPPQENHTAPCALQAGKVNSCPGGSRHDSTDILIKSSQFGGLVLPEGTEKGATYNVASLNLDTSGCKNFIVHLCFSCNITVRQSRVRLRFQLLKQEKCQPFSVPLSTGALYSREAPGTETNTFTLSACDCDSMGSPCCTYSVRAELSDFQAGGSGIIANPVLIATIVEKNECD